MGSAELSVFRPLALRCSRAQRAFSLTVGKMSTTTRSVVSPASDGAAAALLLLPLAAPALAAYAGYKSLQFLRERYRDALAVAEAVERTNVEQRSARQQATQRTQREIAELVASTETGDSDAMSDFLRAGLARLQDQLAALGEACDASLEDERASLSAAVSSGGLSPLVTLERYQALSARVRRAALERSGSAPPQIAAEAARLRQAIAIPILGAAALAPLRTRLTSQIARALGLAESDPGVSRQQLVLIEERIHREISTQFEVGRVAQRRASRFRQLAAEATARLEAVAEQPDLPEYADAARYLQEELAAALATAEMKPLETLARRADQLYSDCGDAAQSMAVGFYVEDVCRRALAAQGYVVRSVEGGPGGAGIVPLDDLAGIEFRVEAGGQLVTELVSISPGTDLDANEYAERACELVDNTLGALRAQGATVREKYRSIAPAGESVRGVRLKKESVAEAHLRSATRHLRKER